MLPVTREARALARAYVEEELIPAEEVEDAVHLAVASLHEIDYRVSWNYEHLIRPEVKDLLPLINAKRGFFRPLRLVTPEELARGGAP